MAASNVEIHTATLCSRTYNGTANRYPNSSGTESPAATHGYYGSNGNWIGMVLLPASFKRKKIMGIKMTMTANAAGTSSNKIVYIYSSNYQTTTASGKGSIYPNMQLGTIGGTFRNQTTTVTLTGSLLEEVAKYLEAGNQMLILYDPTASESNYCRFTNIVFEITLGNLVKYCYNGRWVLCRVYYRYDGKWVLCAPYYHHKGKWIECSSG